MKKFILLFFLITNFLFGATAFNLDGIKSYKIYILSKAKELISPYYADLKELMSDTSSELGIKILKNSSTTMLLKIRPIALGKAQGYYLELNIGEFLKRESINKEVFALSYQDSTILKKEDVKDMLEDSVQAMLDKFAAEYNSDNNHKGRAKDIKHKNFANKMGYIKDFNKALKKANKEKKYIMVVADADACPWCRKLEENILTLESVDKIIKSKFIPALINVDSKGEPKNLKKLKTTPIIYIVDPRDKSIKAKFIGYPNAKNFIDSIVNGAKK